MHLHVVHRCSSPLHLRHPVLGEVRPHHRVFTALQHQERCLRSTDVADGPPFSVVGPLTGATNLRGRRSTGGTRHRAVIFTPRVFLVGEGLAFSRHACHQRQVSARRVAVGADAVGVDAQSAGVRLHPADGAAHILNAGGQRGLLCESVVHVAHHVALHGVVHHQRSVDHIVLRPCTPSAAVNDKDGGSVPLWSEEWLCQIEHSARPYIGAVGDVLRDGDLFLLRLCCQHEQEREYGSE